MGFLYSLFGFGFDQSELVDKTRIKRAVFNGIYMSTRMAFFFHTNW